MGIVALLLYFYSDFGCVYIAIVTVGGFCYGDNVIGPSS